MDLDAVKRENIELLCRCKCCLDDVNLQNLWEEYCNDSQTEIFGAMLEECYSFNWEKKQNEFICNACIVRLREALNFKREIIASEQVLQQVESEWKMNEFDVDVKVETVNGSDEYRDTEYLEMLVDNHCDGLEEKRQRQLKEPESTIEQPKRKWPKKRKGAERLKVYKKYTQLELREAVEAVRSGKMSRAEAAEAYSIPRNTLKNYLIKHNDPEKTINDLNEEISKKERTFKLIEEIKTLLSYTNATPFKTKTARYYCAYCTTEGPVFDSGDELRIHTINEHNQHRTQNVDHFMRPYAFNEVLKLDVNNLTCTLCETKLPDWNGMFQHFSNKHDIEFDEAYTRVIPYILKDNITCVLCHELFNNFHQTDAHMNAHYHNYVCYECGDTFISTVRLDKHIQVHNKGKFPCEKCGKVFSLQSCRVQHYKMAHKELMTERQRQFHNAKKHKDGLKGYEHSQTSHFVCEFCGTVFNYKPNFVKHLQRKHSIKKKCDLRVHIAQHTQNNYVCIVCGECFKTKNDFEYHYKMHHNAHIKKDLKS